MCQGELPAFCKATLMTLSGGRHCGKPNCSKISLYPRGHARRNLAGFIDNAAFNPSFLSHSLTCGSSFFPSPIFFPPRFFQTLWKAVALEVRGGSWCLTKAFLFFSAQKETKMQAHTATLWTGELCNFRSLPTLPSVLSPSLAVPLPHTGGKCSLKASPPTTTKKKRSQSNHKSIKHSSLSGGCAPCAPCTHSRAFPCHCKSQLL